jgi:hypothetical protein
MSATLARAAWTSVDAGLQHPRHRSNGFVKEFKSAVANLKANNIAGGSARAALPTLEPGTGTNPLPIYMAYLLGRTDAATPRRTPGRSGRTPDHRGHGVPESEPD